MKRLGSISAAILFFCVSNIAFAYGRQEPQHDKQDKTKPVKPPQEQKAPPPTRSAPPAKAPTPQQPQHQQQSQGAGQQQNQRNQQQQAQRDQQQQNQQRQQQSQRNQQQQSQQQQAQQQNQRDQQQQAQRTQQEQQNQRNQQQQQTVRPSREQQHSLAVQQNSSWVQVRAGNWQSDHRDWQRRGGYNGYRIPDNRFGIYFGSSHYFRIYSMPVLIYGGYPRFQSNGYWFSIVDPWPEYWDSNWYEDDDIYIEYYNGGYYMQNRRYPGTRLAVSISLN